MIQEKKSKNRVGNLSGTDATKNLGRSVLSVEVADELRIPLGNLAGRSLDETVLLGADGGSAPHLSVLVTDDANTGDGVVAGTTLLAGVIESGVVSVHFLCVLLFLVIG